MTQLRASATINELNPTTGGTITIPASVQSGDQLYVLVTSRDHTSGDAYPTVTDDDIGGNAWTRITTLSSSQRQATVWYKRATLGTAGKTITIAGCLGSMSGGFSAYFDGYASEPPYEDASVEDNASGNETHAGFTPSHDNAMVMFAVFNTQDDQNVTSVVCTDPGALAQRWEKTSTGGADCGCTHWSAAQSGTAGATGTITWAQGNRVTVSMAWSLREVAAVAPVLQGDKSSWPAGSQFASLLTR